MSTRYEVVAVDLTVAANGVKVSGPASGITSFLVIAFPLGNSVSIRIGQAGQQIPVQVGLNWSYDPCDGPETEGLFVDNPVAGAGTLKIVVFYGSGNAQLGA